MIFITKALIKLARISMDHAGPQVAWKRARTDFHRARGPALFETWHVCAYMMMLETLRFFFVFERT